MLMAKEVWKLEIHYLKWLPDFHNFKNTQERNDFSKSLATGRFLMLSSGWAYTHCKYG